MENNNLKNVVINAEETLGKNVLALEVRPNFHFSEGIKGAQKGLTFKCLSEAMNYEKVDIKVDGLMEPPFEINETPVPVVFEGLEVKLWQDWSNKGEVKLSITAKAIKPLASKQIKLGGEKA